MEIRHLKYFAAVVREGNISKAAKALNISQPPLSAQLKQLEAELGVELFRRTTRRIELTDPGKLLYERACVILDMFSSVSSEMEEIVSGSAGSLRIGVVSSVSATAFVDWLMKFHSIFPKTSFSVTENNTYDLIEGVRSGQIELALVRTPFNAPDLECTELKKECLTASGLKKFLPGDEEELTLKDLESLPLIIYRRWERIIRDEFEKLNLKPKIICVADSAALTAELAAAGLGVGIIPQSALPMLRDRATVCKKIPDEALITGICIIHKKNIALSLPAKSFMECLCTRN